VYNYFKYRYKNGNDMLWTSNHYTYQYTRAVLRVVLQVAAAAIWLYNLRVRHRERCGHLTDSFTVDYMLPENNYVNICFSERNYCSLYCVYFWQSIHT
jgi:hypothetical protein